ncbi:MAG: VOC family protein [Actinomycetota bacterium]
MQTTTIANPIGWFEIAAGDIGASERFYAEVFGWSFEDSPAGDAYRIATAGDGIQGGITHAPEGAPERYAIFSIVVPDVAEACAKVAELGGSVLIGPVVVPGGGGLTFANLQDPDGNHFGVFTPPAG